MGNTTHHIQIVAEIKTELQNMDETISKFKSKLNEGISKVDMTKGLGKDLSKLFSKFSDDFSKINSLTPKNLLDIGDSKEFQRTGESIIKTIRDIQRIAGDLGTKELIDAKKLFPNAFDSRVGDLYKELTNLGNSFGELAQKEAELVKVNNAITNLGENIKTLKQASENLSGLKQSVNDTGAILKQANSEISNIRDNLSKQVAINIDNEKIKEAKEEIAKASQEIKELEEKGIKGGRGGKGIYDGLGITEWKKKKKTLTTQAEKDQADNVITLLDRYNELNNTVRQYNQLLLNSTKLQQILAEDPTLSKDKNLKQVASILGNRDLVVAALEKQKQAASDAQQAMDNLSKAENAPKALSEMEGDLTKNTQKAAELNAAIKALKTSLDFKTIKTKFSELGIDNITEKTLKSPSGLSDLKKQLEGLDIKAYEELKQVLKELDIILPTSSNSLGKLMKGFTQTNSKVKEFNDNLSEIESLKSRVAYFFGLANSIQLLKRTVQSALNTVKELDAVMTETAVVTDFTVGDMWNKLPEYADQASALGASIKDLYSATTLYYQQGLNSEQAMSVGVETMKMARIANMDAAEATKAMTADFLLLLFK